MRDGRDGGGGGGMGPPSPAASKPRDCRADRRAAPCHGYSTTGRALSGRRDTDTDGFETRKGSRTAEGAGALKGRTNPLAHDVELAVAAITGTLWAAPSRGTAVAAAAAVAGADAGADAAAARGPGHVHPGVYREAWGGGGAFGGSRMTRSRGRHTARWATPRSPHLSRLAAALRTTHARPSPPTPDTAAAAEGSGTRRRSRPAAAHVSPGPVGVAAAVGGADH
ncbi:hypothetical protein CXG81DRAFT_17906 [Caulochytrium protostelioides]|uniref:Uncharacterized protein n=1 Tax=Caulochytrium protostelioides TaxID=1555241 RepID=A0A4P9XAT4_9FUNG|nr:hypothetical protein CXG81DRAFT_17906 [Caulochytrium protostelioides]|eukprot:RKP02462.1 hypothetical protein CXG81DRAFT_17906 [Caulochytrium protostelioides]